MTVPGRLPYQAAPGVVAFPALVRGELVWPASPVAAGAAAEPFRSGDVYAVPRPGGGTVVLPYVVPERVVEHDRTHLARCLHDLPFAAVLDYLAALRGLLHPDGPLVAGVLAAYRGAAGAPGSADRSLELFLELLPGLFEPAGVEAAVEADLGQLSRRGRDLLDGWVPLDVAPRDGLTLRTADEIFGGRTGSPGPVRLRAVPTRQLHVTAGNSPVVAVLSLVRALATKGAATVKCPPEWCLVSGVLALAMHAAGPDHPLTRHTSLVYWRGGDRSVEDVLLAGDAFDRVVVWGGAPTIDSVRSRTTIRTILFEPRVGMSLIGRAAFDGDLWDVAVRATVDSLVDGQAACTASLVHYVETDEDGAHRYCLALRDALARWDAAVPHLPSTEARAALRRLRREELVGARWYVNGRWPDVTSAVVSSPHPFDLSAHPMSRCVVVRRVDDLDTALRFVDRGVSAVGVWPRERWAELRGPLAARGVTTVAPLGETDRRWPEMPHDGMRPLSELVNWTVG